MSVTISADRQLFFEYVKKAIAGDRQGMDATLTEQEYRDIYERAHAHDVKSFAYDVLSNSKNVPEYIIDEASYAAAKSIEQTYRIWFMTRELVEEFKANGIDAVVLKGPTVAALYPVPEYRGSLDIDIYINDSKQFAAACKILLDKGYPESSPKAHHRAFMMPGNTEIEIHNLITEPFVKDDINKKIVDIARTEFVDRTMSQIIPGFELSSFSPAMQGLHLILHMLQHLVGYGFGIRLLADWACYLNATKDRKSRNKCLEYVNELGLGVFTSLVTKVCVDYLGLERNKGSDFITSDISDSLMERFLNEIFDSKDPSKADGRMVAAEGRSKVLLIKEFHHQMKCNYPRASKAVITWPVLWVMTFAVFLRNNKKVRHVKTLAVLRSASDRSNVFAEMELFER